MAVNRWWATNPDERYFLETTDRSDIGVDLKAPQATDNGQTDHQAYALIKEVRPGDAVVHYHKSSRRIEFWSRVASEPFEEDIVWGSHGIIARRAGVEPYRRPGWRVLLEGPYIISPPASLESLRALEGKIRASFDEVRLAHKGSLYLPLETSSKRTLRPTQFYLTKAPLAWLKAVPQLASIPELNASSINSGEIKRSLLEVRLRGELVGQQYIRANEEAATSRREPFSIDPNLVDRGLRGHARTQNALAQLVGEASRTPRADEPQFDLAWRDDDILYIAEVKSLTERNEERQLRLGLGQVLRYAHLLSEPSIKVRPVLAVESKPKDKSWLDLCERLGVRVVWPPNFENLFAPIKLMPDVNSR